MKRLFVVAAVFLLAHSAAWQTVCGANTLGSDTVVVRVQGEFGRFNDQISNLPFNTYPFPQLIGGSFHGEFSYRSDAVRFLDRRFPFEHVNVSIYDKNGSFLHSIDSGPNGISAGYGEIAFNFGESFGVEAINVPEDLRIRFSGMFSADDEHPPTIQTLSPARFQPFYSFIEVDGAEPFTFWDVDVVSAEITAVPEPDLLAVLASTLVISIALHQRMNWRR